MKKGFFILKIDVTENAKKEIALAVYANEVINNLVSECIDRNTKIFLVPEVDSIVVPIYNICRSQKVWYPNLNDYIEDQLLLGDDYRPKDIYRHRYLIKKKGFLSWIKSIFNKK